jgi:8-oxo-dGTP diphosphatase
MSSTRLRISVVGLFVDQDEVLMLHQAGPPESNCWDLPGGGLYPEEDLLSGLKREVAEETGIRQFTVERLLTLVERFYPEGDGTLHSISLVYCCRMESRPTAFSPTDMEEVGPKGICWLPIQELSAENCSTRAWNALQEMRCLE